MSERVKDISIAFLCPFCGQGNETTLRTALEVEVGTRYIGTGEYVAEVSEIGLSCSGCRKTALCEAP